MDLPRTAVALLREPGSRSHTDLGLHGRVSRRGFWLHGVAALPGLGLRLQAPIDDGGLRGTAGPNRQGPEPGVQ